MLCKSRVVNFLVVAAILVLCLGSMAQAGTWTGPFSITSDANSGISSSSTYTHAVNFGGELDGLGNPYTPTINGVTFTTENLGSDTDNGEFSGDNYHGYGDRQRGVTSATATGAVNTLLRSYFKCDAQMAEWGSQIPHITLTGLTPSTTYTTTFYGITGGTDPVNIRAQKWVDGEFGQEEQWEALAWNQNASGANVGTGVSYTFTTGASGNGSNSISFRYTTDNGDYRLSGFTNMVGTGVQTPEPSALVLVLSGLIGLLAYAWQKRK